MHIIKKSFLAFLILMSISTVNTKLFCNGDEKFIEEAIYAVLEKTVNMLEKIDINEPSKNHGIVNNYHSESRQLINAQPIHPKALSLKWEAILKMEKTEVSDLFNKAIFRAWIFEVINTIFNSIKELVQQQVDSRKFREYIVKIRRLIHESNSKIFFDRIEEVMGEDAEEMIKDFNNYKNKIIRQMRKISKKIDSNVKNLFA